MKAFNKFMDRYFSYPIICDLVMALTFWFCSKHFHLIEFKLIEKSNQISLLPYIISADVSLAGFILAALTIIVTFKSNLKAKGIDESDNALEMIFSSKHYDSIVKVFKKSLIEFILCFVFMFIIWASADNFSIFTINRVNTIGILLTTLAIFRSLYILFVVLELSKFKREE